MSARARPGVARGRGRPPHHWPGANYIKRDRTLETRASFSRLAGVEQAHEQISMVKRQAKPPAPPCDIVVFYYCPPLPEACMLLEKHGFRLPSRRETNYAASSHRPSETGDRDTPERLPSGRDRRAGDQPAGESRWQ